MTRKKFWVSVLLLAMLSGTARALTLDDIITGQVQGQILGASTTGLVGYL